MSTTWVVILGSAIAIYALKAAGPLLLGGRSPPPALHRWTALLPPALLAALVAVSAAADGKHLELDPRLAGLAAAAVALWRRANFVVVVAVAALTTAALRAVTG